MDGLGRKHRQPDDNWLERIAPLTLPSAGEMVDLVRIRMDVHE